MAYCSNCGNEIKAGAVFCGNCGTPVVQQTAAPVAQTPAGQVTFDVVNRERLNMVKVDLVNASFRYEAGAMHYMQGNLELESNVPSVGKMFKSMVTKEKIIKPVISGTGTVFLQPSFGEFTILDLQNDEWILDQGAYYASEINVEIGAYTNRAISAMFSGEKWIQTVVAGTGKVIITSAGPLEEITLNNDKLVVDGRFAVARTSGIDLKVTKASRGIFSTVLSGEGLVNSFTGTGKVLIAPVDNYFNTLISVVRNIDYKIQNLSKN
ncbi:transcriptional regulator [Prolixibacter bellariivorans]|uniref:Transcriptional regulator n=1 Tax=Prolixibacter bellariivorans TaxID=314319 RepID=A0A5M4B450_9BACT|nr:AIM24 family protein [Prolixibacter bellariivorans]GET34593.1 transcriptional regulator [Prolixibacter bellariivorans]